MQYEPFPHHWIDALIEGLLWPRDQIPSIREIHILPGKFAGLDVKKVMDSLGPVSMLCKLSIKPEFECHMNVARPPGMMLWQLLHNSLIWRLIVVIGRVSKGAQAYIMFEPYVNKVYTHYT